MRELSFRSPYKGSLGRKDRCVYVTHTGGGDVGTTEYAVTLPFPSPSPYMGKGKIGGQDELEEGGG